MASSVHHSTLHMDRRSMDPKKRVRPTASNRKSRSKDALSSSQNVVEDLKKRKWWWKMYMKIQISMKPA
ncbi:hypothetical protein QJS04_geneDACA015534 [Acorus gramineus]|uniref:Uncharacterized protein n=1 Tax=Acorus gramineus TaxID=55184 RepID=A0AAV9AQT4_ACOGR|nr:hypothetical protein QJS04_geneDACA015534 [Acorus gramineus]